MCCYAPGRDRPMEIKNQETARPSLNIRLFGPFDVQLYGEPLRKVRSRKEQWLLALLVLRQGHQIERDWLAATLWPDSDNCRALLRDTLSDLRRALGDEARRLLSPSSSAL